MKGVAANPFCVETVPTREGKHTTHHTLSDSFTCITNYEPTQIYGFIRPLFPLPFTSQLHQFINDRVCVQGRPWHLLSRLLQLQLLLAPSAASPRMAPTVAIQDCEYNMTLEQYNLFTHNIENLLTAP